MKTLLCFASLAGIMLLTSCGDVYVKDMVNGTPYERAAKENFRTAKAEGASSGEAYRRSLLAGAEKSRKEEERRAGSKGEGIKVELGGNHESFLGGLIESLLPSIHWN